MTREQYDQLSAPLVRTLLDREDDILREIAAQLAKDGKVSDTSKWRIRQLARSGRFDKRAAAIIDGYSGVQNGQALDMILEAAQTEIGYLDNAVQAANAAGLAEYFSDIPAETSALNAAKAFQRQAASDLNLVNTVMKYKAGSSFVNAVNSVYRESKKSRQDVLDVMGKSSAKVVMGHMSLQEATRKTIRELARKGIPAFTDNLGREWSPEAYIMMDMRSTLANTARAAQDMRCDQYGIQLIEVSSHMGARPLCAPYQGRIFSRDGSKGITTDGAGGKIYYTPLSETSYGQPAGLFGINCGHVQYPFAPGINFQRYFPYPKEENDRRYQQFQRQRAMERDIRATKRECMMLQELDDKEGLQKASQRLRAQKQKYSQYSKDCGLGTHFDRTQVYGYDRSKSMKTVWAERVLPIKGTSVNFAKISQEKPMTKALKAEIEKEYERFTDTFGQIDTISSIGAMAYRGGNEYGGFYPNSREIMLLGAGGENGRAFLAQVAKVHKKSGEWSTASPMHTIRHEMGHALQLHMSINDKYFDRRMEEIEVIYNAVNKEAMQNINRLTNPTESDIIKARGKKLSSYGLVSIEEFISECVAEYQNGSPRATAQSVVEILLKGYE